MWMKKKTNDTFQEHYAYGTQDSEEIMKKIYVKNSAKIKFSI